MLNLSSTAIFVDLSTPFLSDGWFASAVSKLASPYWKLNLKPFSVHFKSALHYTLLSYARIMYNFKILFLTSHTQATQAFTSQHYSLSYYSASLIDRFSIQIHTSHSRAHKKKIFDPTQRFENYLNIKTTLSKIHQSKSKSSKPNSILTSKFPNLIDPRACILKITG